MDRLRAVVRVLCVAWAAALAALGGVVLLHSLTAEASHPPGEQSEVFADGTISIVDFEFMPKFVTVTVGSKVTWMNNGSFVHTSTSDGVSIDAWNSGAMDSGGVFSKTFTLPGAFGYHCEIHSWMTGTVFVLNFPFSAHLPLIVK